MEETINLAIDYMKILEEDDDTTLVELDLLHIGKNRNQYYIGRDAVERAIPSMRNKPIIYRLNNEFMPSIATDVVEHGTLQDRTMRIAGTIPESAPMTFVKRDGKEYLRTKGIIHKIYQPSLMNILQNREGNLKISIEIYVTDKEESEDGTLIVNDFKFEGVALLGKDILEGIEGSQMNVIKFSAKDLNDHYLKFTTKEIPQSVKECASKALEARTLRGKGGSSSAVSMAKYLVGNDYIDYARLNSIKDYFNRSTTGSSLSFSLYGGEYSKEWLAEISRGKSDKQNMKVISLDYIRDEICALVRKMNPEGSYKYWVATVYSHPQKVVISDEEENKYYLVEYEIKDEGEIVLNFETKTEVVRSYIPADELKDSTLLFSAKEVLSIENGQLISNTHRLSSVDSVVARKAATLLNSLEKEDEGMEEKEDEKKVDNALEEVNKEEKEETKLNVEEAEKVVDEEKEEDKEEDEKEENDEKEGEDEDFVARCNALETENKELKASLETYKRKEELEKMNSLVNEFSYCFKAEEKEELAKDLEHKTFAEVENIVNEKIKEFAKENKPKEEDEEKKESKFSIGLLANSFNYKREAKKEENSLKDVKAKYSKNK